MMKKISYFFILVFMALLLVSCLNSDEEKVVQAVVSVADRFKDPSSLRITAAFIRDNGDIAATISAKNSYGGIVTDSYLLEKTSYGYRLGKKLIALTGNACIRDYAKVNSAIAKELSKKYSR